MRVGWKRSSLLRTALSGFATFSGFRLGNAEPVRAVDKPCLSCDVIGAVSLLVELTEVVEPVRAVPEGAIRDIGRGRPFDALAGIVAEGGGILVVEPAALPKGLVVVVDVLVGIVDVRVAIDDELLPGRGIGSRPAATVLEGAVEADLSTARAGALC